MHTTIVSTNYKTLIFEEFEKISVINITNIFVIERRTDG